ncbi:hypothetical protein PULV_a1992 [Pseudoalteromonas ulvae UL12]|nr:hypothetical protein [Pseudoalteromonas ulvae UL12]
MSLAANNSARYLAGFFMSQNQVISKPKNRHKKANLVRLAF